MRLFFLVGGSIYQKKTEHISMSIEFELSRIYVVTSRSQVIERDKFRLENWSHKIPKTNYINTGFQPSASQLYGHSRNA
jgi:hypothetical protein